MNITEAMNKLSEGIRITRESPLWDGMYITPENAEAIQENGLHICSYSERTYSWVPTLDDMSANDWMEYAEQPKYHHIGASEFESICKKEIARDLNEVHRNKGLHFLSDDIYTVWICKTLQNNKGLFSSQTPDGLYYECTYSGDKGELYIDRYIKQENKCIKVGTDDDAEYYSSGFMDTFNNASDSDCE